MTLKFYGLLAALLTQSYALQADSYHPLAADYMLAGQLAYGDIESGKTHLYLKIKGGDAIQIFNTMTQTEHSCLDGQTRSAGNMVCHLLTPKSASYCVFAIDMANNQITLGETC